jgi:hypothetical protein
MLQSRRLLKVFAFVASVLLCAAACIFVLTRSAQRELGHWTSPDGAYHLIAFEGELDWRGFPLGLSRHHYLYVGRDRQASGYGHRVTWDPHSAMFDPGNADLGAYVRAYRVDWSGLGVTIEEGSGHRIFIPSRAYLGGR